MKRGIQLFALAIGVRLLVLLAIRLLTGTPLETYALWYDGPSYLDIARSFPLPYDPPAMIENARHYPLYPLLVYLLSLVLGNVVAAGYIVSLTAGSLAVVVFYRLARRYTANAFALAATFSAFPPKWLSTGTFLWSEPLFMLVLVSAFLLLAENKNTAAYALLGVAALARPVGVLFLGSFILYELVRRSEAPAATFRRALLSLAPFALFHAYLALRFGHPLLFQHAAQGGSWGGQILAPPLAGLVAGLLDPDLLAVRKLYTGALFLLYAAACGLAFAALRDRRLALLALWFIPYFLFTCFLKGAAVNWWMISFSRLALPVAPAGLILAGRLLPDRWVAFAPWVSVPAGVAYAVAVAFVREGNVVV